MEMKWGYMVKGDNSKAQEFEFLNPALSRGPHEPPDWSMNIDQPAGALAEDRKQAYRDLKDVQTADLDTMFSTASLQEKAQAFELVKDVLKSHIITNHSEVYHAIGKAMQAQVLNAYDAQGIHTLMSTLGINSIPAIMDGILEPLFSIAAKAKAVAFMDISGL